jgi:hypothetical protein
VRELFPPMLRSLADAAPIADDPAWRYDSSVAAGYGVARLRAWRAMDGQVVAIVTESGEGASVTNSAEHIHRALLERFGPGTVVIEHYLAGDGVDPAEHFHQVSTVKGAAHWRPVPGGDPTSDAPQRTPNDACNLPVSHAVFQWIHTGLECSIAPGLVSLNGYVHLPESLRGHYADEEAANAHLAVGADVSITYANEHGWVGFGLDRVGAYWSPDDLIGRVSREGFMIAQANRARYEQHREANPDEPYTPQPVLLTLDGVRACVERLAEHAVLVAALAERGRA